MAVGALGAAALIMGQFTPAASAKDHAEPPSAKPFEVMSQNLYLGADVGVAIDLLPDLAAAAQFMWDQVAATDFTARAPKLAGAAARYAPDVIGLQEATTWSCRKNALTPARDIYNFTEQYLQATADAGVPYVVAAAGGEQAFNPSFAIPPIPGLTVVYDPATFQPIFGQDSAACGFETADALLVRADLADAVTAVGQNDYERIVGIPGLIEIQRGYVWADVTVSGHSTRFVATHLESTWTENEVTPAGDQARELAADLAGVTKPLVVMGDFNSDPRDPRPAGAPNPGGQPEASDACPAQPMDPTPGTASTECNSYWVMRGAGYTDIGPDADDPMHYTWGSEAELAGPDSRRIEAALELGNPYGFTDRLDYVFVRNGVTVKSKNSPTVIGNVWPDSADNWICENTANQIQNTEAMSQILADEGVIGAPVVGTGVCLPTDHAGLVSELRIVPGQLGKR
jgi:hypothetical protein